MCGVAPLRPRISLTDGCVSGRRANAFDHLHRAPGLGSGEATEGPAIAAGTAAGWSDAGGTRLSVATAVSARLSLRHTIRPSTCFGAASCCEEGWLRPLSQLDIWAWLAPASTPRSAWVNPSRRRARRMASPRKSSTALMSCSSVGARSQRRPRTLLATAGSWPGGLRPCTTAHRCWTVYRWPNTLPARNRFTAYDRLV